MKSNNQENCHMLFISSKIESSQLVRSSPSRRLGLVVGKTGMDEDDDTLLFWRNSTNCSIFLFSFQTDLSLLDEMDEDAHTEHIHKLKTLNT